MSKKYSKKKMNINLIEEDDKLTNSLNKDN